MNNFSKILLLTVAATALTVSVSAQQTQSWSSPGSYTFGDEQGLKIVSATLQGGAGDEGETSGNPGNGGRAEADIDLAPGTKVWVYVGGGASYTSGGFNGGADGVPGYRTGGGGGGATDIRLQEELGTFEDPNRILVAGGGGGGGWSGSYGGDGGGLQGQDGQNGAAGGTQTSGYEFLYGNGGEGGGSSGGGGGGWFGGQKSFDSGGGGGSGYCHDPYTSNCNLVQGGGASGYGEDGSVTITYKFVPVIENYVTTPNVGNWRDGNTVDISAKVTPPSGETIADVRANIYKNGSAVKSDVALSDSNGDSVYEASDVYTFTELNQYSIEIVAEDSTGALNRKNKTQETLPKKPELNIENPSNDTVVQSPVDFSFTPTCYYDGCKRAELYFNNPEPETRHWITDTTSEWAAGNTTNVTAEDGSIFLTDIPGFDNFEDDISDWENVNDRAGTFELSTQQVYQGDTSGLLQGGGNGEHTAFTKVTTNTSKTKYESWFYFDQAGSLTDDYRYRIEYGSGVGGGTLARWRGGNQWVVSATDTTQGTSWHCTDSQTYAYVDTSENQWVNMNVTFDFSADTVTYTTDQQSTTCTITPDVEEISGITHSIGDGTSVYVDRQELPKFAESQDKGQYSKVFGGENTYDWVSSTVQANSSKAQTYDVEYAENNSGSWSYYSDITNVPDSEYLKKRIDLQTNSSGETPEIQEVDVGYNVTVENYKFRKEITDITSGTLETLSYDFLGETLPRNFDNIFDTADDFKGTFTSVDPADVLTVTREKVAQIYGTNYGQNGNGQTIQVNLGGETINEAPYTKNGDRIEFNEQGTYLVSYSTHWKSTTADARHIMKSWIEKNSNKVVPSETRCYVRADDSTYGDRCSNSATLVVEANSGDTIRLMGTKDHGTGGTTETKEAPHMNVRKVTQPIAQVYDSSGGQNYDSNTVTVNMDTKTQVDTSEFTFQSSQDGVEVSEAGWYKIYYTVNLHSTFQSDRHDPLTYIRVNGQTVPSQSLRSTSYIRNDQDGDQNHNTAAGLVKLDAGDTVSVRLKKEYQQSNAESLTMANKNWMVLHRANSDSVTAKTTENLIEIGTSWSNIPFQEVAKKTGSFSYDKDTDQFTAESSGLYTVSYAMGWDDTGTGGRHRVFSRLTKNGEKIVPSKQGDYSRGFTGGRLNQMTGTYKVQVDKGDTLSLQATSTPEKPYIDTNTTYISISKGSQKGSGQFVSEPVSEDSVAQWQVADKSVVGTPEIDYAENTSGSFVWYDNAGDLPETQHLKYRVELENGDGVDSLNLQSQYNKTYEFPLPKTYDWGLKLYQNDGLSTKFESERFTNDIQSIDPPEIKSVSTTPSSGNIQYQDNVGVSANVTEENLIGESVDSVWVNVYEEGQEIVSKKFLTDGNGDNVFDSSDVFTADVANRDYRVVVTANNTKGGIKSKTYTRSFEDNTKPELSLNANSTAGGNSQSNILVSATASDNLDLKRVDVTVDGSTYSLTNTGGDVYEKNVTGLEDGSYTYEVEAADIGYNTETQSQSVTLDTEAPDVEDVWVTEGESDGRLVDEETVDVTAEVTEEISLSEVTIYSSIYGDENKTMTATGNGNNYTASFTVNASKAAPSGSYNITVNATDSVGNTGGNVSEDEYFLISSPPPEIELVEPEDGAVESAPVNFTYIPTCYGSETCKRAELTFGSGDSVSGWWNETFEFRKDLTLTENSGEDLTNYQVETTISYTSEMQQDFSDLRFVQYDSETQEYREAPYYIKSKTDGSQATVMVKVPEIPANSDATLQMYYGNPEAESESSKQDAYTVYDLWDDSPSGTIEGDAHIENNGDYIELTENVGGEVGYYYWDKSMNGTGFIAQYDHYAGGGGGADGQAFWAYADQIASNEENNQERDAINFNADEYQGDLKISAPYDDQVTTYFDVDTSNWRTFTNTYDGETAEFKVEGNTELTHTVTDQSFENTDNYLGFVGRTGGIENYHRVRRIKIKKWQGDGNQPTVSIGEEKRAVVKEDLNVENNTVNNITYTWDDGMPAELDWSINLIDAVEQETSSNTRTITSKKPDVDVELPTEGDEVVAPVDFVFTPKCYSVNGCDRAEIWRNGSQGTRYTESWKSGTDWNEGTLTNLQVSDNSLNLSSGAASGTWDSPTIDGGTQVEWADFSFTNANNLQGGNVEYNFEARTDGGNWNSYEFFRDVPDTRYFRYSIDISRNDDGTSPKVENAVLDYDDESSGWSKKKTVQVDNNTRYSIEDKFTTTQDYPKNIKYRIRVYQSNGLYYDSQNRTFNLQDTTLYQKDITEDLNLADTLSRGIDATRNTVEESIQGVTDIFSFRLVPVIVDSLEVNSNASIGSNTNESVEDPGDGIYYQPRVAFSELAEARDNAVREYTGSRTVVSTPVSRLVNDVRATFPRAVDGENPSVSETFTEPILTNVEFIGAQSLNVVENFERGQGIFSAEVRAEPSYGDGVDRGFIGVSPREVSSPVDLAYNTFIGQYRQADSEEVQAGDSITDQIIRVRDDSAETLTVVETLDRVAGSGLFSRTVYEEPDTVAQEERQFVGERNASSEVVEAAYRQALGFFRQNNTEQVNVDERMQETIIRVRLLNPEDVNVDMDAVRGSFDGERSVEATPELVDATDRELTADRTVVSVTEIKDKQVLGFIRDDISEQLEVEEEMIETITRVEFIPANEVRVNESFNRTEYIGNRDVDTRLDLVDSQDRNISAARNLNLTAGADASEVAVGRFFNIGENVSVNESVTETYTIVEFIDQEETSVVENFQRGLLDASRDLFESPEGSTETDRQVVVDREVDVMPGVNTESDERLIYVDTLGEQWSQSYTTDLDANFSDSVASNFNSLTSLGQQVNATSNVTQQWVLTASSENSVSVSERVDQSLDPVITVYQRFALGKNISDGDVVESTPIVEERDGDVIYTPIGSDESITNTITGRMTADTSQLGLSVLMILVIFGYLGVDYYRKRKIVKLYKADKTGSLSKEEREKAKRYLQGRTGV